MNNRIVSFFQFTLDMLKPNLHLKLTDPRDHLVASYSPENSDPLQDLSYTKGIILEHPRLEKPYTLTVCADHPIADETLELLGKVRSGILMSAERFGYYEDIIDGLNSIDEGISITDKDGILIFANQSCYNITESSAEEMINLPINHYTREQPILMRVIKDGQVRIDFEYYLTFKDKTIHLINSAYPIKDENGCIQGAIDVFRDIKRSRKLADNLAGHTTIFSFDSIIGKSPLLKQTIENAKVYANTDKSILIQGESGTGKELFAQSIHNYSYRSDSPFVALNCANIPSELIDSELFGYEEGAFTGARRKGKQGKFELAHGGTVFLDEIGELPLPLQAKLLRVLETKEISRIGSNKVIHVDIRVIAATHKNLDAMVAQGLFRADLLYRLKVLHIQIPPLRERRGDIPLLAAHLMKKYTAEIGYEDKKLSADALELLTDYPWPGNIRELDSILARAVFLSQDRDINAELIRQSGLSPQPESTLALRDLDSITQEYFTSVYTETGGNKKRTAELLGISRPTVYRLIRKYNVKF